MKGHSAAIHRCLMLPSSLSPHVRSRHRPGGRGYLRNCLSHPLPLPFSSSPSQLLNVNQFRLSLSPWTFYIFFYSYEMRTSFLFLLSLWVFHPSIKGSILPSRDPSFHQGIHPSIPWHGLHEAFYSIDSIQILNHHNSISDTGAMLTAHEVRTLSALCDSSSLEPDDMILSHVFYHPLSSSHDHHDQPSTLQVFIGAFPKPLQLNVLNVCFYCAAVGCNSTSKADVNTIIS